MASKSRGRKKRPSQPPTRGRASLSVNEPAPVPTQRPKAVRFRPEWHKVVGGVEFGAGALLMVANYAELSGSHVLPFGYQIWYFVIGGALAYYSTVWFGWWDRPR